MVGGLQAFCLPAYVTAAATLLPKEEYGRATARGFIDWSDRGWGDHPYRPGHLHARQRTVSSHSRPSCGEAQSEKRAILLTLAAGFFFNDMVFGLSRGAFWWGGAVFLGTTMTPVLVSSFYGLWQSIIPADLQGRVIAARDILVDLPVLLGALLAGPWPTSSLNQRCDQTAC